MSAIQEIVKVEIDRLRKEAESLKAQSKVLFQKADALESELGQIPQLTEPDTSHQDKPLVTERGGRAEAVIGLLDANPTRVYSPESMHRELQVRVDPSLVSRLKKDGRIAKARSGGYCSVNAPESIKDEQQSTVDYTSSGSGNAMTQ